MAKKLIFTLVFAALLSLGCRAARAADNAGEVLTFNGNCFVVNGDQRTPLKMGDPVHVGDVIDVPEGAKLKLRMADGSVLALASGTHMTIQSYTVSSNGQQRDARLGLDTGLVHAVVSTMSQPSNFEVGTATGVAAARSTDWFVEDSPDRMAVGVLDGNVSFAARDPKTGAMVGTVNIPPDSGSEIDMAQPPPPAAPPAPGAKGKPAPAPVARRIAPTPAAPWARQVFATMLDRTSVKFGFCQCITDTTGINGHCVTGVDGCKAVCAGVGNISSYVPDAHGSCARFYGDVSVPRGNRH
ncbi:MAG TPA: FecR family protein [Stellaceae bacterium]|jgi:hypothetical protein